MIRVFGALALTATIAGAGWAFWTRLEAARAEVGAQGQPSRAVAARQLELLKANLGRPADTALEREYEEINLAHFSGALPSLTVRWEPGLAGVGALAAQKFTLEGMFGTLDGRMAILLNPSLQASPAAIARALCHEMVHLRLFTRGDSSTKHGPAFKAELQRLSMEGAFEGVAASDEDKASLRAWLDAEGPRLAEEKIAIEKAASDPSQDRAALSDRAARHDEDAAYFNREADRYNLMIVYPDGFDEDRN